MDKRNTAVGWIILLALIFFAFLGVAAVATSIDQPKHVTCTSTTYTVECVTR